MIVDGRYLTVEEFNNGLGGVDVVDGYHLSHDMDSDALRDAESTIESWLIGRYVLPLTPALTPKSLKQCCINLVRYTIKMQTANAVLPDSELALYEFELKKLQNISKGIQTMPGLEQQVQGAGNFRLAVPPVTLFKQPLQGGGMDGQRPAGDRSRDYKSNDTWLFGPY